VVRATRPRLFASVGAKGFDVDEGRGRAQATTITSPTTISPRILWTITPGEAGRASLTMRPGRECVAAPVTRCDARIRYRRFGRPELLKGVTEAHAALTSQS